MAFETVVHPETRTRNSLALDAIVEIEETALLILRMLQSAGCDEPDQRPLRGVAIRLLSLAGVALGAIDYESGTVAEIEATLHGTGSASTAGAIHV